MQFMAMQRSLPSFPTQAHTAEAIYNVVVILMTTQPFPETCASSSKSQSETTGGEIFDRASSCTVTERLRRGRDIERGRGRERDRERDRESE